MAENKNIEVGGRFHSIATGNVVAGANEVLDDAKGKKQSVINSEVSEELDLHTNRLNGLSSQNYVTVEAIPQTTVITDVLPATGAVDTVYRVGKWDGSQYRATVYSEYAWNGTQYKLLDVKEYAIDDEPTAGSNNLVKSDGIHQSLFLTKSAILQLDKEGKFIAPDGSYGSYPKYNTYKLSNISTEQILNITVFMAGNVPNALLFDEDGNILASINTGETTSAYRTFSVDLTNYPLTSYLILNTFQYDTHNPIDLSTIRGNKFDYNHDEVIQQNMAFENDPKLITSGAAYKSISDLGNSIGIKSRDLIAGTDYMVSLYKDNTFFSFYGDERTSSYYQIIKVYGSAIVYGKKFMIENLKTSFNGGIMVAMILDESSGDKYQVLASEGKVNSNNEVYFIDLSNISFKDKPISILITCLKTQGLNISLRESTFNSNFSCNTSPFYKRVIADEAFALYSENHFIHTDGTLVSANGYNIYKYSITSPGMYQVYTQISYGSKKVVIGAYRADDSYIGAIREFKGSMSPNNIYFSSKLIGEDIAYILVVHYQVSPTLTRPLIAKLYGAEAIYDGLLQVCKASLDFPNKSIETVKSSGIYKAVGGTKLLTQGTDYDVELFKENVYIDKGVFINSNFYKVLKISGSSITKGKRLLLHELKTSYSGGIGAGFGHIYAVLVDGSMRNVLSGNGMINDNIVNDHIHSFYANLDLNINNVDYLLVTVLKQQALQISISELLAVKENTYDYQVLPNDSVTLFRENTLILPNGSFSTNSYFDLYKFDIGSHNLYQVYTEVNFGGGSILPVVAAYRNDDSLIGVVQSSTTAKQWYEFPTIFKGENVQYVLIVFYKGSSLEKPIVSRYTNYLVSRMLNDILPSFPEQTKKEYYVGANRTGENTFTTLKACTEYIRNNDIYNAVVRIDPGLYDLVVEYGKANLDEYVHGNRDDMPCLHIGNNTHYIFEQGAKVKCLYDGTNSDVSTYCSAFNVSGSFTLENADVEVENMRYCVHEDLPTSVQDYSNIYSYIGTYKNCFMRHKGNPDGGYTSPVCIGGGCFRQSLSIVEGGVFIADMHQHSIGWHNYYIANFGDYRSKIIVKNVYATGLYLGKYGDNLVDVEASGCKLLNGFIYNNEHPENWFDIKEWNNITQ